jgi:hypothetical protein
MKVLIDADACPDVHAIVTCALHFQKEVLLVCDTAHLMSYPGAQTIMVSKGSDAVDFSLLNRVQKGDLIITQDYGLAALGLSKQALAVHPNGWTYNETNMEDLLMSRHISKKARQAGHRTKGPAKRTPDMTTKLIQTLTDIFQKALREDL